MVLPKWDMLHRVSEAEWRCVEEYGGSYVEGTGTMVCGKSGEMRMPGIFSRMGLKRCPKCCKAVGVPPGYGAPFNDKLLTKKQQGA
jgi:hypothetical protein